MVKAISRAALFVVLASHVGAFGAERIAEQSGKGPGKTPVATAARLPVGPLVVGGPYAEQGPGTLRDAQVEGMTDNPVVGAVEALAAHPTDSNTVWAGGVNGGIWKTTNALTVPPTWTNQTPTTASLSISALEVDPTDATGATLFAGFGNRSSFLTVSGALNGLLKTTDGGTTWTAPGTTLTGRSVSGLAPRGTVVVAAVRDPFTCGDLGIWRSTDSGASFTHISDTAALPCGRTFDLASDPLNPAHLFTVLTSSPVTTDRGIWRSTDTGATWTNVATPYDGSFSALAFDRVEIAVGRRGTAGSGFAAGANVFFAACTSGKLAGFFGSTDAGGSWSALDLPSTPDPAGSPLGLHPGSQCSLHLSIAADPAVHTAVYVGGDRQPYATEGSAGGTFFPNSSGASNYTGRLFRADSALSPGSQTYPVTHCSTALAGCGGAARTASSSAPHADSREMVFLPNGHLVESDDGGVYRNASPNSLTGDWVSMIGNLAVQEQHDVIYDQISKIVLSGNQDTGAGNQSVTGSSTWDTRSQGDGGDVAVARNDPTAIPPRSTRYYSSQNLSGFARHVFNDTNGSVSLVFPALTVLSGGPAMQEQFVTPVVVNSIDPTRLVFGCGGTLATGRGVYESADRGDSVTQRTTTNVNTPTDGGGPTMVYGVTGNADALYVAAGADVLVRTVAPPTAPTTTSPGGGTVLALAVKPGDVLRAIAVTSTAVYTTANGGTLWTDVTANLGTFAPGTLHSAAYVEGVADDIVAVGTDRGVYRARVSLLGGATSWDQLGTGLPNALVYDLHYEITDDVLTAGTMGRGAFKLAGLQATTPVELIWMKVQ